jgi:hypothetical protein
MVKVAFFGYIITKSTFLDLVMPKRPFAQPITRINAKLCFFSLPLHYNTCIFLERVLGRGR